MIRRQYFAPETSHMKLAQANFDAAFIKFTSANFFAFPVTNVTDLFDITPSLQSFFNAGNSADMYRYDTDGRTAYAKTRKATRRIFLTTMNEDSRACRGCARLPRLPNFHYARVVSYSSQCGHCDEYVLIFSRAWFESRTYIHRASQ